MTLILTLFFGGKRYSMLIHSQKLGEFGRLWNVKDSLLSFDNALFDKYMIREMMRS